LGEPNEHEPKKIEGKMKEVQASMETSKVLQKKKKCIVDYKLKYPP